MAAAKSVVPEIAGHIEARADEIVARGAAVRQKTDDVFDMHVLELRKADGGLDDLEEGLRGLSNGPLIESGERSKLSEQPPPPEDSEERVPDAEAKSA